MLSANQISRFLKFFCHNSYFNYKVPFLNVIKFSCKLQFDHVIFFGFSQACPKCSEKNCDTDFEKRFGPSMWCFGFKWYTTLLRISEDHRAVKKYSSWIVIENALNQSDCIIFIILISQKLFMVESLLFACNKISIEAAVWYWSFSWVSSGMPGIPTVL